MPDSDGKLSKQRTMLNFRRAFEARALELASQAGTRRPRLAVSGGSYSEVMLRAALSAGLDPEPVFLKGSCCNWHEWQRLESFCAKNHLNLRTIHSDEASLVKRSGRNLAALAAASESEYRVLFLGPLTQELSTPLWFGTGLERAVWDETEASTGEDLFNRWKLAQLSLNASQNATAPGLNFFASEPITAALSEEPLFRKWFTLRSEIPFPSLDYWLDHLWRRAWPDFEPRTRWSVRDVIAPFLQAQLGTSGRGASA